MSSLTAFIGYWAATVLTAFLHLWLSRRYDGRTALDMSDNELVVVAILWPLYLPFALLYVAYAELLLPLNRRGTR